MVKTTANDWIEAALALLAEHGPGAVAVEPAARRLGVTKGSFYWHFEGRDALLHGALTRWEQVATEAVIQLVDQTSATAAVRLQTLTDVSFVSAPKYNAIEAAVRGWALNDEDAAEVVSRVDRRRLDYVTALLTDGGLDSDTAAERAAIYYRVLIGEFSWCGYGGTPLPPGARHTLLLMMWG